MPTKVIASSFALVAFALAVALGAYAGNSATTTIWRAIVVMGVCYVVGQVIGHVGRIAMNEHVERYKREHPMPELDALYEQGEPVEDAAGVESQDAADAASARPTERAA